MESNLIPALNFASLCLFSTTIVAGLTVFYKIKLRWPVKVNCWFCNSYSNISRKDLSWWLCSFCKQYNGFTKDGDYRYAIPEQMENNEKNFVVSNKTKLTDYQNGLCETCNDNEEFKLMELRRFENSRKHFSNNDLNKFKRECDEKYPLCMDCQKTVKSALFKQSLWLTEYRLLFMHKSFQNIINDKSSVEFIFRIILIITNVAINCPLLVWFALICGTSVQLMFSAMKWKKNFLGNVFLLLLWIDISILLALPPLTLLVINSPISWISMNFITTKDVVTLFRIIIAFESIQMKPKWTGIKKDISFKRIESFRDDSFSDKISKETTNLNVEKKVKTKEEFLSDSRCPVSVMNTSVTTLSTEKSSSMKATNLQKRVSPEKTSTFSLIDTYSAFPSLLCNSDVINQSAKSLSSLSLSDNCGSVSTKSNSVFSAKIYGTTSSEIFQKRNARKVILAPSKLRLINQTPWSVSNFWQDDLEIPSLSRSSSQSSGFGSNAGEASRENSFFDLDRFSVVSETTHCCHQRHHCDSIANHIKLKRDLAKRDSVSQCSFFTTKCDHSNVSQDNIASPKWLSMLLCGSLVFNIIVLCVVLLR